MNVYFAVTRLIVTIFGNWKVMKIVVKSVSLVGFISVPIFFNVVMIGNKNHEK